MSSRTNKPWQHSEQAWLTAQSLCLLKIRCDTMANLNAPVQIHNHDQARLLVTSVASRADFGFTTGATRALMSCISETTKLASDICYDGLQLHQEAIKSLHQRILACSVHTFQGQHILQLHHRIFQLGVIVYFHRSVLNSLPHNLLDLLEELLTHVKTYRDHMGGYVTLWPIFIAAVEAYKEHHQEGFREWLDNCDQMGAANRKDIRDVIENVWRKRLTMWQHRGAHMELGSITVDWREVMQERGCEVLLV